MTQVNSRLLTIETGMEPHPRIPVEGTGRARRGSLDQVQEVVVVAGGQHKVHAIHRLLAHARPDKRRFMDERSCPCSISLRTCIERTEAVL